MMLNNIYLIIHFLTFLLLTSILIIIFNSNNKIRNFIYVISIIILSILFGFFSIISHNPVNYYNIANHFIYILSLLLIPCFLSNNIKHNTIFNVLFLITLLSGIYFVYNYFIINIKVCECCSYREAEIRFISYSIIFALYAFINALKTHNNYIKYFSALSFISIFTILVARFSYLHNIELCNETDIINFYYSRGYLIKFDYLYFISAFFFYSNIFIGSLYLYWNNNIFKKILCSIYSINLISLLITFFILFFYNFFTFVNTNHINNNIYEHYIRIIFLLFYSTLSSIMSYFLYNNRNNEINIIDKTIMLLKSIYVYSYKALFNRDVKLIY